MSADPPPPSDPSHSSHAPDGRHGLDSPEALTLVMPVYNEQDAIESVLEEWHEALSALGVPFVMRVYDDGSKDATAEKLAALSERFAELRQVSKENEGHGPTVLRGYAAADTPWVCMCDSDGEMPAAAFAALWALREDADLVLGSRVKRVSPWHRRVMSWGARKAIPWLFGARGASVPDANTPLRLMRGEKLREALAFIPDDTFAPNVALSGIAARQGWRIALTEVAMEPRRGGTVSLVRWKVVKAAVRCFNETRAIARQVKRAST